jgi:hypothetical protein
VYLKVSPIRGLCRFRVKGKLSPRFIGPFKILERVGEVAYRLELPVQLADVLDVFHISRLKKGFGPHDKELLLTPKFGKESDLWVQLDEESVWRKEGFLRCIRQKGLRSTICFRSARE